MNTNTAEHGNGPAVYAAGDAWESMVERLAGLAVSVRTFDGSERDVLVTGYSYPEDESGIGTLTLDGLLWDDERDVAGQLRARYSVESIRSIYVY